MNIQDIFKPYSIFLILILSSAISNSQTTNNFKLVSPAFDNGKPIPAKYTCDSSNISPPLSWSGGPANTKSFTIIMEDPDAPMMNWVHWVIYNIPVKLTNLHENIDAAKTNATDGFNSWFEKGYNGPCPSDGTHHYTFTIYALDKNFSSKDAMTKDELLEAMKGHILAEAKLNGLFRM